MPKVSQFLFSFDNTLKRHGGKEMNDRQDSPLPKPPKTPFGRDKWGLDREGEQGVPMLADRMAMAAAQGRLEEFIKTHIPDSDHARALAMMVLGMSGMADIVPPKSNINSDQPTDRASDNTPTPLAPEEMLKAVNSGDINSVKEILKEEYLRRSGPINDDPSNPPRLDNKIQPTDEERDLLQRLQKIASDNKTSTDWLMMRALKLYIEDYERTGRL